MTNKETSARAHEEAYKKAVEELDKEKIAEIKAVARTLLQKRQEYKDKKEEAEEAIRLINLDLDDLREGKIDKIRERHEKSVKAVHYAPIEKQIEGMWYVSPTQVNWGGSTGANGTLTTTGGNSFGVSATGGLTNLAQNLFEAHNRLWNDLTSGTYTIETRNGPKEFYL